MSRQKKFPTILVLGAQIKSHLTSDRSFGTPPQLIFVLLHLWRNCYINPSHIPQQQQQQQKSPENQHTPSRDRRSPLQSRRPSSIKQRRSAPHPGQAQQGSSNLGPDRACVRTQRATKQTTQKGRRASLRVKSWSPFAEEQSPLENKHQKHDPTHPA